jgi:hypothetical protein
VFGERVGQVDAAAQGQRIHVVGHQVPVLEPWLARDWDANHKIALSGEAAQEHLECGE